jgi:hypothetical protein
VDRIEQVLQASNQAPRRRASIWTVIATVAGAISAAAAVFPLVSTDQQFVHLTLGRDELFAETLAEPVIFTGNWHVRRIRRWWRGRIVHEGRAADSISSSIKDKRLHANSGARTFLTPLKLYPWADNVEECASPESGDFKLGLEFKGKAGLGWAYTKIPICIVPRWRGPQGRASMAETLPHRGA